MTLRLALIQEFRRLILQLKVLEGNKYKIRRFEDFVSHLEKMNDIRTLDDIKRIPGVGEGILRRTGEVISHGVIQEVEKRFNNELVELQGLIGTQATLRLLKDYKFSSIRGLYNQAKQGKIKLDHRSLLMLKYTCGEIRLEQNIPRAEMEMHSNLLKNHCSSLDKQLKMWVCGSYRRGLPYSNDIDVLVCHQKDKKDILRVIIDSLDDKGYLVDHLTNKGNTLYRGFCRSLSQKNVVRRIDIRYVPFISRYTALLYFTGSKQYNQFMRARAHKNGFILNEYGIMNLSSKVTHYPSSEREVFKMLGLPYKQPPQR
jgi:DNA polymerase/3'-5' exonuclease PolX